MIFNYTVNWSYNQVLQTVFLIKMWIIWKIYNGMYRQKPSLIEEYKSLVNTIFFFLNWLFREELLRIAAILFSFFMIWTQRQSQCRLSQRPFYSREQLFRSNWRHSRSHEENLWVLSPHLLSSLISFKSALEG